MSVPPEPTFAETLTRACGGSKPPVQRTTDGIETYWIKRDDLRKVLRDLKRPSGPFEMLYDLTAIDETRRKHRGTQPPADVTVVYHLMSFAKNRDIRLKIPLTLDALSLPSITDVWPVANWYEREVWDMFGVHFDGHPNLRRILLPWTWEGHPLRKEHAARATEMGPFELTDERWEREEEALQFRPEEWGLKNTGREGDYMFLNIGPQHPGTHGVLRLVLQLDGERLVDVVPDVGFHHRGAEKMAERQSWHTYIPYTDRVDYLGGVMNNFPYVMAVETLAGIEVPDRVKLIRIMTAELFRISSHLVWYGTFGQDVGAFSPVFYMFADRERILDVIEAVCGERMHPNWFRIGGVAQDLPEGWDKLVRDFIRYFPGRLAEYDKLLMKNRIFRGRTQGIGEYTTDEALEWGVTGPGLRACGFSWDFRKQRPYSGYDQLDFDVPTADRGDCFGRALVRIEEMRQSLRIIEQCVDHLTGDYAQGPHKADHPLTTPPPKERTMKDIETLIAHFLEVSWGPVIPAGEAFCDVEGTKGNNGYYLVSDGNTSSYRTRIRSPSFPHMQMVPEISRDHMIPDLMAILGSVDFVLADVDR